MIGLRVGYGAFHNIEKYMFHYISAKIAHQCKYNVSKPMLFRVKDL